MSGTSCEGEKKNRGNKLKRKDCRRKDCEEGEGERGDGGDQHSLTHRRSSKAPVTSVSAIPVAALRPSYHSVVHLIDDGAWQLLRPRLRLRAKHDCSAHD